MMLPRWTRVVALAGLAASVWAAPVEVVPVFPSESPSARILAGASPTSLPLLGPPPGWELKEIAGKAKVAVVRMDDAIALHMASEVSSFVMSKPLSFDLPAAPILTWKWKVTGLPKGGDVRKRETDDAVQVYVVFPRGVVKAVQSHVIGYVWDATAPVGTRLDSPQPCPPTCNVKLIVLQSGAERLGQWLTERRNVLEDYRALFGGTPPKVGALLVQVDSDNTKSSAEAFFQDFLFQPDR